jgi:hypothetical protein
MDSRHEYFEFLIGCPQPENIMIRRPIIQLALIGTLSLIASAPARANVPYLGGRVLSSVRIIPIFYGSSWTASERGATIAYLTDLADYIRGAKNPVGAETLYAQYALTGGVVVDEPRCSVCVNNQPRLLSSTDITNIVHSFQTQNNNYYARDKVFIVLPGPGYRTVASCGFTASEGDNKYYATVPHGCLQYQRSISRHVFNTATNPNAGDGWMGVVDPCLGSVVNFGAGEIQLPWNNRAGACPPAPGGSSVAFTTKAKEVLQVLATTEGGALYHALRYPDRTWTAYGDVKAAIGSDPGALTRVDAQATQGVFNHVVAVGPAGKLYHTLRQDTGWLPFGDVNTAAAAGSTQFTNVSLANVNNDLYVCGQSSGSIFFAIRFQNGTWRGFESVLPQTGFPPNSAGIRDVECAGIGSELHIAMTTSDGGLYHSIRYESGFWQALGDVEAAVGQAGDASTVTVANFGGDLHMIVKGGSVLHTARFGDGSGWLPFAPLQNLNGTPESIAGASDRLYLVSIGGFGSSLEYRSMNAAGSSDGDAPAGNPPSGVLFQSVGIASSLAF